MKIRFRKAPKKLNKKLLTAAAEFFALSLFSKSEYLQVKITIAFKPPKDELGNCGPVDYCKTRPCRFVINIDPTLNDDKKVPVLAHEMAHVMRYHRGELAHFRDNSSIWKGRIYWPSDRIDKVPIKEYEDFPWEKEARRLATSLVEEFQPIWLEVKDRL